MLNRSVKNGYLAPIANDENLEMIVVDHIQMLSSNTHCK